MKLWISRLPILLVWPPWASRAFFSNKKAELSVGVLGLAFMSSLAAVISAICLALSYLLLADESSSLLGSRKERRGMKRLELEKA